MSDSQYNQNQFHYHHHHQNLLSFTQPHPFLQQPPQPRTRGGGSSGVGEIVAVQGGHIVRSTGRKDRHSKVCTARGTRDRRVRLSAHTAIQFYDVQDRLGYDRPSKAVDWLINNAKEAIDKLAELPAWQPSTTTTTNAMTLAAFANDSAQNSDKGMPIGQSPFEFAGSSGGGGGDNGGGGGSTSFLPPSLDSDTIADTIKSFFPMAGAAGAAPTPTSFQSYTPDLLSRTGSQQSQELRLSLQSFQQQQQQQQQQEPMFHHHSHNANVSAQHSIFSGSPNLGGASSSIWAEQGQRMVAWNVAETGGGNAGNYMFNMLPAAAALQPPSQFFIRRGPLQSSNQPSSMRGWQTEPVASESDHQMQHQGLYPAISSIGFASSASGFGGFRIPARIQGEEEHDGGMADKPHSASSASHHH